MTPVNMGLFGVGNKSDDGIGISSDPSGAEASDGTADDQNRRARRHGTDQAVDLEDEDGEKEGGLQTKVVVGFSLRRLEAAVDYEEGRAVQ